MALVTVSCAVTDCDQMHTAGGPAEKRLQTRLADGWSVWLGATADRYYCPTHTGKLSELVGLVVPPW